MPPIPMLLLLRLLFSRFQLIEEPPVRSLSLKPGRIRRHSVEQLQTHVVLQLVLQDHLLAYFGQKPERVDQP